MKKKLTEGRKPVVRFLPPMKEAFAGFKGFAEGENRAERLYEWLAHFIHRRRRAEPQAFYAMREVAAFFGVSLFTVSSVYRRLSHEGALTRVRSSQTMIAARAPRPRHAVRGVVCMPIWLPGFMQFLDWRKWFTQLQEELSGYRFVLEPVFYGTNEDDTDFVDRILQFNPDYLLWNYPLRHDEILMQSVADTGVSLLIVQNSGQLVTIDARVYWQSSEQGMKQGLREWKTSGEIDRIILPQQDPTNLSTHRSLIAAIETGALPYEFKTFPGTDELGTDFSPVTDFIRSLTKMSRTGIIFSDDLFHTRLCAWAADEMQELCRRHRVMVFRQVFLPSLKAPSEVMVDAVLHPAKQLARRIASDLNKGLGEHSSQKITYEADWRPRTLLSDVVHRLLDE